MKQPDDTVYLHHVLDSIVKVDRYLKGVDEATFVRDSMIQDAVIRQIQIIGEAVRRISPALRDSYPSIPWQEIARMRSKLVHDYFGVHLPTVYSTAVSDLPPLEAHVRAVAFQRKSSSSRRSNCPSCIARTRH